MAFNKVKYTNKKYYCFICRYQLSPSYDLDYHKALIEKDSINKQNFLDIVIKDNFNYESFK